MKITYKIFILQEDFDGDGLTNEEDEDDDGDGVLDGDEDDDGDGNIIQEISIMQIQQIWIFQIHIFISSNKLFRLKFIDFKILQKSSRS